MYLQKLIKIRSIILFLITCCLASVGYSGEKELYIFGGGGEPVGSTTIFDESINIISKFTNAKKTNWRSSYSFNGGHEETEKLLQTKLSKSRSLGKFDEKNFLQAIDDLKNKLESGKLKSGDQLLLIFNTHGSMNYSKEKTHLISLSSGVVENLKTLSGAKTVSMDRLEEISILSAQKGVKLAIVDLSCFSGNTLKIANKNICVISASGENNYSAAEPKKNQSSYQTFSGLFLEGLKKGANLEDIFLKARLQSGERQGFGNNTADFPMISTEMGLMLNDLIYKIIEPFLIFDDRSNHGITDFNEIYDGKILPEITCKTESQYSEIKKLIDTIASFASISGKTIDTYGLRSALDDYRRFQVMYENSLADSYKASNEVKDIILRDYPDKVALFNGEDGLSVLATNRDYILKDLKKAIDDAKSEQEKQLIQGMYDEILTKDMISKDVSQKISAESKIKIKKFIDFFKYHPRSKELASRVSIEAKKIYDKLYRANTKNNIKGNPCKDFIL